MYVSTIHQRGTAFMICALQPPISSLPKFYFPQQVAAEAQQAFTTGVEQSFAAHPAGMPAKAFVDMCREVSSHCAKLGDKRNMRIYLAIGICGAHVASQACSSHFV